MVRLRFPFDARLKNALKEYPGVAWVDTAFGKEWVAPREMVSEPLHVIAARFDLVVDVFDADRVRVVGTEEPGGSLLRFQREAAQRARTSPDNGFLFNFEMGLGKTPAALEATRLLGITNPLIVCPAMVRAHWVNEIRRWRPDLEEITEICNGDSAAKIQALRPALFGATVTTYGLLHHMSEVGAGAIILDELHYLQGESAARTMACDKLLRNNPIAWRAGLTGTLITRDPMSMWKPLNTLFPGRFGTRSQYGRRYCKGNAESGYGTRYFGVNDETSGELRERLSYFSERVTKDDPDVAALLPPFIPARYDTLAAYRYQDAAKIADNCVRQGASKVLILTHLRRATQLCAAAAIKLADENWTIVGTSGEDPVSKREKIFAAARARDPATPTIVCATMHCCNVGINLNWFDDVIFAELDLDMTAVVQALGRFARLGGGGAVRIHVLWDRSGDRVGNALLDKIRAAGDIIKIGRTERLFTEAMPGASAAPALSEQEKDLLLASMAEGAID